MPQLGSNHVSVLFVLREEFCLHVVESFDLGLEVLVLLCKSVDLGLSLFLEGRLVLFSDRISRVVLRRAHLCYEGITMA